ncbi:hypothetical protein [uncultured Ramlibacter sp.]|uniref:hypothetical protein n=1 Tax=uncultured Ramlibacter sp. TaxID=260755 RepID=UPI00260A0A11|nr:hypothetical protein [uncultured Ramlibacter sp.]
MATAKKTTAKKTPAKALKASPARKASAPAPVKKPALPQAPTPAAGKAVAAPAPAGAAAKTVKADKPKKPKLVRDSFTIPKAEFAVLDEIKQRAGKAGVPVKKSEILRAGIKALAALGDAQLLAALRAVPAIKTGRPAKD